MESRFKTGEPSLDSHAEHVGTQKPQVVVFPEASNVSVKQVSTGALAIKDWSPLHDVKASVQVFVGQAVVTVGELLAARENQVLCLDTQIEQPVDLKIEGKTVARGQLVAVDGHFAVRITQLPVALGLSSGN